jgi:hypothetical protein
MATQQRPGPARQDTAARKSVARADDLVRTTEGGIELTETELGRVSGGFNHKAIQE